jgi:hypothetical protein
MTIEEFLRRQAEQIRVLAKRTADPEIRKELEDLAASTLAELEALEGTNH